MIVVHLKLNNLFAFRNFEIDFSQLQQDERGMLEGEHLVSKPNFKYKKINIIMGTNASGKTSLGKAINRIFVFMRDRNIQCFYDDLLKADKVAKFCIDFVNDETYLYRLKCEFLKDKIRSLNIYRAKIGDEDSYKTCVRKLRNMHKDDDDDYIKKLAVLEPFTWLFTFPKDEMAIFRIRDSGSDLDLNILEKVLIALDSSITSVEKSSEIHNSYVIRSKNGDMFVQDGSVVSKNILSSGTKAGMDIAYLITSMMQGTYEFFYCDEQFSFIHSDIEKAILSLMLSLLKPNTQLFFTTHNLDLLDISLPIHSFTFLKKGKDIEIVHPEDIEIVHPEESSRSKFPVLKEAVQNDVFSISPDVSKILDIERLKAEDNNG